MIPCNTDSEHPLHWKKIYAKSYIGAKRLVTKVPNLNLSEQDLQQIDSTFPIHISGLLLDQLSHDHPAMLQYMPNIHELTNSKDGYDDPVGDVDASIQPGLIKKYNHRVLLITSNTCPIHCRYCFRRNFSYPTSSPNTHLFHDALAKISQDQSINEVILSGGDPLSLDDNLLDGLIKSIEKISHVDTIRLHTKFPSIYPDRITSQLLDTLNRCKLNKVCVFHINHPDEISQNFCDVVQKIKNTGTTTLNQSVLLKNVNNNSNTLISLSHKLFKAGILPYYLHELDHAKGTQHFRVSSQEAQELISAMKANLPGYLVPKLAREIPGAPSKLF